MHLNKGGVKGKQNEMNMDHRDRIKKVQNRCNEMSLHEESDDPQFSPLQGFVSLSKCTHCFQFKTPHNMKPASHY